MEREFIAVNERCFITVTSAIDYRPWVPYENAMLCLTPSSGTVTTTNNKMFRRVNKYSSVYFLPWTVSLTKTLLAILDWLSQKWLMTQLQTPCMEFKLVITLIHHDNRA